MRTPPEPDGGPVVVRVANCQSVSAGPVKAANIFRAALTKAGQFGVPDVVLGCECADFDAIRIAKSEGWEAHQFGLPDDTSKMGSVLAWRNGEANPALLLVGSEAGEGIRARHVVTATVKVNGREERFTAGHAPPDRAPNAQAEWLANVDDWPGVIGADFNTWPKTLTERFDRQVHGVQVLSLLVPRDIPCSNAEPINIGSDHPAVDVVLWPDTKDA